MTATTLIEEPATLATKSTTTFPRKWRGTDLSDRKPAAEKVHPGIFVAELLIAVFVIGNLLFLFGWAVSLGPITTAGFFGWLTYLSTFTYFLWSDEHDVRRTYPGAQ